MANGKGEYQHRNLKNRFQFKEQGEIAEVLGVSVSTVKNWMKAKVLPWYEIEGIRFVSKVDLVQFIERHRNGNNGTAA